MLKYLKKNWYIFLSAFLLTINFVCDCQRNKKNDASNYLTMANTFRPKLVIQGAPEILEAYLESIHFGNNELQGAYIDSMIKASPKSETLLFPYYLNLRLKYSFNNIGNTTARILAFSHQDSVTADPFIRDHLMEGTFKNLTVDPYYDLEIIEDDSQTIEFPYRVRYKNLNEFTLHFLILYENDFGNLYDSYYTGLFNVHMNISYVLTFTTDMDPVSIAGVMPEKIGLNTEYKPLKQFDISKPYLLNEQKHIRKIIK